MHHMHHMLFHLTLSACKNPRPLLPPPSVTAEGEDVREDDEDDDEDEESEEDPLFFLGWVRLYLVGCGPPELREVVRACCETGAMREPELHREITHVAVSVDVVHLGQSTGRDNSVNTSVHTIHGLHLLPHALPPPSYSSPPRSGGTLPSLSLPRSETT